MEKINIEVEKYKSFDGLFFVSEERCLEHELKREDHKILEKLFFREIKTPILSDEEVFDKIWYLVRNEDEKSAILRRWCGSIYGDTYINGSRYKSKGSDIELGDWVCKYYMWNSDGEKEQEGVYTLSFVMKEMNKFLDSMKIETVDGKY